MGPEVVMEGSRRSVSTARVSQRVTKTTSAARHGCILDLLMGPKGVMEGSRRSVSNKSLPTSQEDYERCQAWLHLEQGKGNLRSMFRMNLTRRSCIWC